MDSINDAPNLPKSMLMQPESAADGSMGPVDLRLIHEGEAGSELIVAVPGFECGETEFRASFSGIPSNQRLAAALGKVPPLENIPAYAAALEQAITDMGARRCTVIGCLSGAAAVELMSAGSRSVRRAILIDPVIRKEPSGVERLLEKLDRFLPAGLPLVYRGADYRSALHRLRCPSLVVLSRGASPFIRKEAAQIMKAVPNAWLREAEADSSARRMIADAATWSLVQEFLDTPAKRPWKNTSGD